MHTPSLHFQPEEGADDPSASLGSSLRDLVSTAHLVCATAAAAPAGPYAAPVGAIIAPATGAAHGGGGGGGAAAAAAASHSGAGTSQGNLTCSAAANIITGRDGGRPCPHVDLPGLEGHGLKLEKERHKSKAVYEGSFRELPLRVTFSEVIIRAIPSDKPSLLIATSQKRWKGFQGPPCFYAPPKLPGHCFCHRLAASQACLPAAAPPLLPTHAPLLAKLPVRWHPPCKPLMLPRPSAFLAQVWSPDVGKRHFEVAGTSLHLNDLLCQALSTGSRALGSGAAAELREVLEAMTGFAEGVTGALQ